MLRLRRLVIFLFPFPFGNQYVHPSQLHLPLVIIVLTSDLSRVLLVSLPSPHGKFREM